jgi:hypothetical protein
LIGSAYRQIKRRIAAVRRGVCGKRSRVVTISRITSARRRRSLGIVISSGVDLLRPIDSPGPARQSMG